MTVHYEDESVTLHHGDCLDVLRELPDSSVDAVVTDPPYGISFMGREWDQPDQYGSTRRGGENRSFKAGGVGVDHKTTRERSASMHAGQYDLSRSAMHSFQDWCEEWATECLRILKPGGHLLSFGGSRTWHRLAAAVEDAGFEIRDSIAWLYGSGFPKSLDVSKAIDKLDAAEERLDRARKFQSWLRLHMTPQQVNEATGTQMGHLLTTHPNQPAIVTPEMLDQLRPLLPVVPARIEQLVRDRHVESQNFKARQVIGQRTTGISTGRGDVSYIGDSENRDVTVAHTEAAQQWQGWGTALKPAFEPIVVGRKPFPSTVAANVLEHGTGALNIDACRTATSDTLIGSGQPPLTHGGTNPRPFHAAHEAQPTVGNPSGRWPTNVVLDESQAAELDKQTGTLTSGYMKPETDRKTRQGDAYGQFAARTATETYGDSGGASRFFPTFHYEAKAPTSERPRDGEIAHPTVKPLDLMRWLVHLVTPPGGTVLEPFAGSGTTAEACVIEGFKCIAIEREADYLPLIVQRLSKPIQVGFDFEGGAA